MLLPFLVSATQRQRKKANIAAVRMTNAVGLPAIPTRTAGTAERKHAARSLVAAQPLTANEPAASEAGTPEGGATLPKVNAEKSADAIRGERRQWYVGSEFNDELLLSNLRNAGPGELDKRILSLIIHSIKRNASKESTPPACRHTDLVAKFGKAEFLEASHARSRGDVSPPRRGGHYVRWGTVGEAGSVNEYVRAYLRDLGILWWDNPDALVAEFGVRRARKF